MRWVWRQAKRGLIATFVFVGAFALVALALWSRPDIALQPSTLEWARVALNALNIPVSWQSGSWSGRSVSFWKKRFTLELQGPCYVQATPFTRACFESLSLDATVDFKTRRLHIHELGVPGGRIHMEAPASKTVSTEPAVPSKPSTAWDPGAWASAVQWDAIAVGPLDILWASSDLTVRLRSTIQTLNPEPSATHTPLAVEVAGHWARQGVRSVFALFTRLEPKADERLGFTVRVSQGPSGQKLKATTQGVLSSQQVVGTLDASVQGLAPELAALSATGCRYQIGFQPPQGSTQCTVQAELSPRASKTKKNSALKTKAIPVNGTLDLDWDSQRPQALGAEFALAATDFSKLVKVLKATPWAVPAPINDLGGTLEVKLSAQTSIALEALQVQWKLDSALKSKEQKLIAQASGTFDMEEPFADAKTSLQGQVLFRDSQITLPRVDPVNLPRFFPDPRIVHSPLEQKAASQQPTTFRYHIEVATARGQQILLHTPQYGTRIPLTLDLEISDELGTTGKVELERFPVELFRRKAVVEHVRISLPPDRIAELSASATVSLTDYEVNLEAFGQLDAPRYEISSVPPLSESSALSLLLFGRTAEELDPGQDASVADARAALANGAVSALSFYLLASTPVESIGFDAQTGRLLATVRLVEGTSLRIEGERQGVTSLGLRQRLGRDWVLSTYVERATPLEPRDSVSTFLEWSRVY